MFLLLDAEYRSGDVHMSPWRREYETTLVEVDDLLCKDDQLSWWHTFWSSHKFRFALLIVLVDDQL